MTKKWPRVSLAQLVHLERRSVKVKPTELYQEIGVYCFGRGVFHKPPRTGLEVGEKSLFMMKLGDFILQITFAWEGAVALIAQGDDGLYGSSRYLTFRVDESRCCPQFLLNYFKTHAGVQQLANISPGSAGRNRVLNTKRLPEVMVPLPSLSEQRRVNEHLTHLSTQIAIARSLRTEGITDTEALQASIHTKLSAGRKRKLGQILRLAEDSTLILTSGSYPQAGLRSFGGGLFAKTAVKGMETTYKNFNRLYGGAVVLSQVKGWEGAIASCPASLAGWFVSPEYRTFQCILGETNSSYMAELVKTRWFWSKLRHVTRGVGARRERIRPEQFLEIEILMPDIEKQVQGEKLFEQVSQMKRLQAETDAAFDALLPSLLSREFSAN